MFYLVESKDHDCRRGFGRQMRKEKNEQGENPIFPFGFVGNDDLEKFRDTMQLRFDLSYLIKQNV